MNATFTNVKMKASSMDTGMVFFTMNGTWHMLDRLEDTAKQSANPKRHVTLCYHVHGKMKTERRNADSMVTVRFNDVSTAPARAVLEQRHLGYFVPGHYGAGKKYDTLLEAVTVATQQGLGCIDRREFWRYNDGSSEDFVAERINLHPEPFTIFSN